MNKNGGEEANNLVSALPSEAAAKAYQEKQDKVSAYYAPGQVLNTKHELSPEIIKTSQPQKS